MTVVLEYFGADRLRGVGSERSSAQNRYADAPPVLLVEAQEAPVEMVTDALEAGSTPV